MTRLLILFVIGFFLTHSVKAYSAPPCPDSTTIFKTLDSDDINAYKALIVQLTDCGSEKHLGAVWHKLGVLYYLDNELDAAIIATRKALSIREELYLNAREVPLGKSYHNLGVFNLEKLELKKARLFFEKAAEVFNQINSPRLIRSCLELANLYDTEGEYALGNRYFKLAINKAKEFDDEESLAEARINFGGSLNNQKEYLEALSKLKAAKAFYEETGDSTMLSFCFNNLGVAYYHLEDNENAIQCYQKATELFNALDFPLEKARTLNNLGIIYLETNRTRKAFLALNQGLSLAKENESIEIIAQGYDNLGDYFLKEGDANKALQYYQKAIQTIVPDFFPDSDWIHPATWQLKVASFKPDLLVYLGDKAKAMQGLRGREDDPLLHSEILSIYQLGDQLIDQIRQEQSDAESKLLWRERVLPFYEKAIAFCYTTNNIERAFFFIEKSKAILLLEALEHFKALETLPPIVRDSITSVQKELVGLKSYINRESGNEKTKLIQEYLSLHQRFDRQIQSLAQVYPKYIKAKFGAPVISLPAFQDRLASEQLSAFTFFLGPNEVYGLFIKPDTANLAYLGNASGIERQVSQFLAYFQSSSAIENNPDQYTKKAFELFQTLFKSQNLRDVDALIIFPSGLLAFLPFDALVADKPDSGKLSESTFLLEKLALFYGYAAHIYVGMEERPETPGNVAVFAPFSKDDLPYTQAESKIIGQSFSGTLYGDNRATKKVFLKGLNQYKVLHLATHAYSSQSESKPRIVFYDSTLFLPELYTLTLKADLVVLSACQSNVGKLAIGEGVMSLGRGFSYAGAKSLLATLWNVNDKSTAQILTNFYGYIKKKEPKFKALQRAKLDYLKSAEVSVNQKSPYYWAGLTYYGDADPLLLIPTNSLSKWWIIIGCPFAFLFAWLVFRKVKRS